MKILILTLKGMAMGAIDTIPGISSSTLAIILGIYEQLTSTIGCFVSDFMNKSARRKNIAFLAPIFLGSALGILIFSGIIGQMVKLYPMATQLFFIGLILGSLPLIAGYAGLPSLNLSRIGGLIFGSAIMIFFIIVSNKGGSDATLSAVSYRELTGAYAIRLFFVGFVCAATMVVPGVSGSMLMVLLGEYYNIIAYVNSLSGYLLGKSSSIPLVQSLLALSITGVGILCGVIIAARFINWALHHAKNFTFSTILAMMSLSIMVIWPGMGYQGSLFATNVLSLLVGIGLALVIAKTGNKRKIALSTKK